MDTELLHHHTVNAGKVRERDEPRPCFSWSWHRQLATGRKVRSPVLFPSNRRLSPEEVGSRLNIICRGC